MGFLLRAQFSSGKAMDRQESRGCWQFSKHVAQGRWFMVFASSLIMAGAGATYLFSSYSKEIKSTLGYDQTTLNTIGFCKDVGANVGFLSGLIAELTPSWFVLLLGAATNFGGYLMVWLSVTKKIAKPEVWQMCLYFLLGAHSQNFANTAVIVSCVNSFPYSRGVILGLLKGFVGLSAAIITQLHKAMNGDDSKSIILLIAWLPAIISTVFAFTVRNLKPVRQPNEIRVFFHFSYIATALGLFIMGMTISLDYTGHTKSAYFGSVAVICALLFLPVFIAIREELFLWNLKNQRARPPVRITVEKPMSFEIKEQVEPPSSSSSHFSNIIKKPKRGEDYTILQALLSVDMIIIFVVTFCGLGADLAAFDNIGQLGESLGYPEKTIKKFVSSISVWSYFGRIFAGFASETLLQVYKFPRPLMITAMLFFSCIGHVLIALSFDGSLYFASIIIGFSSGAQLPLIFATISEIFGLKHYGTLLNCGQLGSPLGSYVLNVLVAGRLYDAEANNQMEQMGHHIDMLEGRELICYGVNCYRSTFVILAGVTLSGGFASLLLVKRTSEFYKSDIYKRFREDNEEQIGSNAR